MVKKVKNVKRWRKGDSCLTNATSKKYRSKVSLANGSYSTRNDGLTKEALQKFDSICQGTESVKSFSTIKTFASNWSQCTNSSFSKFFNEFDENSDFDQQTLAVLKEATRIIKEKNGDESSIEYYALLMNMLKNMEDITETTKSAIFYLLGMLIKNIRPNVLNVHFSVATKPAMEFLEQCNHLKTQYSLLNILGYSLKALEPISWTEKSVQHIFNHVLVFIVSSEPKLRKIVTKKIIDILVDNRCPKAVQQVFEFCVRELTKSSHEISILFMMNFLKLTLFYFETSQIQKICGAILVKIKSNNTTVISSGLKTFSYLFTAENTSNLTADLNEQLIVKLFDCQPNNGDETLLDLWMNVQLNGFLCLIQKDLKKCSRNLPKFISVVTTTLLCDSRQRLVDRSSETLVSLFDNCVSRIIDEDDQPLSKENTSIFEVIFGMIEKAFSFQSNQVWPNVFRVVQVMFRVCGRKCARMFETYLIKLVSLRQSPHCEFVKEVENCIGTAIRYLGVEMVLLVIPIQNPNKTLNEKFEWMLPLLKTNVRNSSIAYFMENLYPIAENLKQIAIKTDGSLVQKYNLIFTQIWSLLPSFSRNPTDFKETNFRETLKFLGSQLKSNWEIRSIVMEALRNLIRSDIENDTKVMTDYVKNYVPILLNLYITVSSNATATTTTTQTAQKVAEKNSICDTIKPFFEIANNELRLEYLNEIVELLKQFCDADAINETAEDLVDLLIAIVPFQKIDNLIIICEYCSKFFLSTNYRKMQKKSYRLLRSILECFQTEPQLISISENIQSIMLKARDFVCVTSRNYRIGCLINLLHVKQPSSRSKFLRAALDESVTGLNDTNSKFRDNCSQLICEIADVISKKNAIGQFLELLVEDVFEPSVPESQRQRQKLACTISAIAIVMTKHPEFFSVENELTSTIFDNVFQQLKNSNRPIMKAALQCTRIFCKKYTTTVIYDRLPIIVSNLAKIDNRNLSKFRTPIKYLLSSLLKSFDRNTLTEHIPETNRILLKLITNDQKLKRRKARAISQQEGPTSSMDDDENENDDDLSDSDQEMMCSNDDGVSSC